MKKEQVCEKIRNQIKGCGMEWNRGLVNWKVHLSLLLKRETEAQRRVKPSKTQRLSKKIRMGVEEEVELILIGKKI